MSRLVSSSAEFHSVLQPVVPPMIDEVDTEMKMMEEETASTVDSSTLLSQTYSGAEFQYSAVPHTHASSTIRPASKGKAMKKMKTDDAEDEEVDIDKCISEESSRVSVKILRKIIPKLRIACYYSDEQVSGKRKLKHLWDEKPADWPMEVPFKDPNNAIKDTKKPGKEELTPMYEFLRKKYMEKKAYGETGSSSAVYNNAVVTSSSIGHTEGVYHVASMYPTMSHAQPADDSQGMAYMTPAYVVPSTEDIKDQKIWNMTSWPPLVEQNHTTFPSEDDRTATVLAPTRPEHPPRALHHQLLSNVPLPDPIVSTYDSQGRQPGYVLNSTLLPAPVTELYCRLKDKQHKVELLSGHNNDVKTLLAKVQKEVIDCLYDKLTHDETRLCLMFLDAGHQYEALLDVMLVLRKNEGGLLTSGCQEIINKFDKECGSLMMMFGICEPRGPEFSSMISNTVKSAVYGFDPSTILMNHCLPYSPAEYEKAKLTKTDDDTRPMFVSDLSAALGVIKRPGAGQHSALILDLEPFIRPSTVDPELYTEMDDEKKLGEFMVCLDTGVDGSSPGRIPYSFCETVASPPENCDFPTPNSAETVVGMGSLHSGTFISNGVFPTTMRVTSAGSISEEMDTNLNDIDDLISKDMGSGPEFAAESASAFSSWDPSSSGPVSFGSGTWSFDSNCGPGWPMPAASPIQTAAADLSRLQFGSDTGAHDHGMRPAVTSSSIPLSVSTASVDDFEEHDQRHVGRRRSRMSRGSITGRGLCQNSGRS